MRVRWRLGSSAVLTAASPSSAWGWRFSPQGCAGPEQELLVGVAVLCCPRSVRAAAGRLTGRWFLWECNGNVEVVPLQNNVVYFRDIKGLFSKI